MTFLIHICIHSICDTQLLSALCLIQVKPVHDIFFRNTLKSSLGKSVFMTCFLTIWQRNTHVCYSLRPILNISLVILNPVTQISAHWYTLFCRQLILWNIFYHYKQSQMPLLNIFLMYMRSRVWFTESKYNIVVKMSY